MVEQLGLGLRAQVLDVGCGPGWMSEYLARCGYWVTGVDISEDMVGIARERVAAIPGSVGEGIEPQAEFHAMPVRDMPWESRFDAAVLYDTMHHFDGEVETLRVILRTLAPGGRIYIREGREARARAPRTSATSSPRWSSTGRSSRRSTRSTCAGRSRRRASWTCSSSWRSTGSCRSTTPARRWGCSPAGRGSAPGRRKPATNTLIATKPVADTGGADAWRARVTVAAAPAGGARRLAARAAARREHGARLLAGADGVPVPGGHRQHRPVRARATGSGSSCRA